jgi:prolyl-tRNA editing enzyme YbaK/EbsC (Cys-tRNA(Pro) deacylase)
MSIEKAKAYLAQFGLDSRVLEFDVSSATVELAALAVGVEPARICKTLSFKTADGCLLVLAAGDARIDNKKFKATFGIKAKMPTPEEVIELVGHPVGGVCPFGINEGVSVYPDVSLQRFDVVYPAVGSANSAIPLSCEELFKYSGAEKWVDVCKLPEAAE